MSITQAPIKVMVNIVDQEVMVNIADQLCDEISRLFKYINNLPDTTTLHNWSAKGQFPKNYIPATAYGDGVKCSIGRRLSDFQSKIADLRNQIVQLTKESKQLFVFPYQFDLILQSLQINEQEKEITENQIKQLIKENRQLREAPALSCRVGRIIDEQEKEITELKKCAKVREAEQESAIELQRNLYNHQQKEITKLKAEISKGKLCDNYNSSYIKELYDRNTKLAEEAAKLRAELKDVVQLLRRYSFRYS